MVLGGALITYKHVYKVDLLEMAPLANNPA